MSSLRDIRRRVRSVEKTQQITSAMRMVAAAKLRRAQDAIIAARPYSRGIAQAIFEVGRRQPEAADHPLLEERRVKRSLGLLVVTSDRGLCGAFNANAIKHAESVIASRGSAYRSVRIAAVGRKAVEYLRRHRPEQLDRTWTGLGTVTTRHAEEIATYLAEQFLAEQMDDVLAVGNEFVSALTQRPVDVRLLPFVAERDTGGKNLDPFTIEPDPATVFAALVPAALEFTVYRVLLETQAGEHAARMTAMESATRNTEELIRSLTLQFNRARQAAITKELVEIVSGAEAL